MSRKSSGVKEIPADPMFLLNDSIWLCPDGTIHGFFANIQAKAIWALVAFFCSATFPNNQLTLIGFERFRSKSWNDATKIRTAEFRIFVKISREKPLTQRTERHKTNSQFLKSRQHLFFGAFHQSEYSLSTAVTDWTA